VLGWLLAMAGPPLLTVALAPLREQPAATLAALSLLALTVACALAGGLWPALASAVLSTVLLNYFFTPPLHTLDIADGADVVTLLLFLAVAVSVASVVDRAARRSLQARAARQEADTLSRLNRTVLASDQSVAALLDLVRETFSVQSAALLDRDASGVWQVKGAAGSDPPARPEQADADAVAAGSLRLVLRGHRLTARDLRLLSAFATHLSVVLEREEIARREAAARQVQEGDRLRAALLAAVSHDLRTPLAGVKAAVSSLQTPGITWSDQDRRELLGAIESSADRLDSIVSNLLDMSRLQAGVVPLDTGVVGLDDVVARAVGDVVDPGRVDIALPPDLPEVTADVGLLVRVVANLVQNAVRHTRPGTRVAVAADARGDRVRLRVVDHGPGVPDALKPEMFRPFQRLGDTHAGTGVGLGLAVAKGLTEAQGGALHAEDTPGGGLTLVVELPCAAQPRVPVERDAG
jgi:two-component system sensor histidine kinase KdpD